MIVTLGYASMLFAFFAAVYGILAIIIGQVSHSKVWLRSGKQACLVLFPLLSVATGALLTLLIRNDYQVDYVFKTVNNFQPLYLKISALWGKQSGSLLFWSWLFSLFLFIWALRTDPEKDRLFPTAAIFLLANLAFTSVLHIWIDNPFVRYWQTGDFGTAILSIFPAGTKIPEIPSDGMGMNPLLRHFGMVYHPPALYLGFIAVFFSAAFEISGLIHSPSDDSWMKKARPWTIFTWIFLAVGLILGSRWAYDVLGWGGYWGWDPVEVGALIPFLLMTAYLHAVIGHHATGRFRRWASVLSLLTYGSIVFAVFVTRSGLISSVHAFSASPVSSFLSVYLAATLLLIVILLLTRRQAFKETEKETELSFAEKLQTKESLFTAGILLLCIISVFCLWGILLPTISELISGTQITIGVDYYEKSTGPLFALLLLVMGLIPLTNWKKPLSRKQWITFGILALVAAISVLAFRTINNLPGILLPVVLWVLLFSVLTVLYAWGSTVIANSRSGSKKASPGLIRFFASYLVHAGIILMAFGIIGIEFLQIEEPVKLIPNESLSVAGFDLTLTGSEAAWTDEGDTLATTVEIHQNGKLLGTVRPHQNYYTTYCQQTTIPGVHSSLSGDVYLIMTGSQSSSPDAERTFTVFYNPWVTWLWIGSIVLCLGGLLLFFGSLRKPKVSANVAAN